MIDRKLIKRRAFEVIGENWLRLGIWVILPVLIELIIQWILSATISDTTGVLGLFGSLVTLAVSVCISLPLTASLAGHFLHISRGGKPKPIQIFLKFKANYGRYIGAMLYSALWIFIWSLPGAVIVGVGVGICAVVYGFAGFASPSVLIIVIILSVLACIPAILAALSYAQVPFLVNDNKQLGPTKLLKLSKHMMKGYKGQLFAFQLSFLPWFLIPVIIVGIIAGFCVINGHAQMGDISSWNMVLFQLGVLAGMLTFSAYMRTALAGFYERLKQVHIADGTIDAQLFESDTETVTEDK